MIGQPIPFRSSRGNPAQAAAILRFEDWLRRRYPALWAEISRRYPGAFDPAAAAAALRPRAQLAGLAQTDAEPETDWAARLENIAKTVLTAYEAHTLFRTNLKLAEQGRPPLDPSVYAPAVGVKVGLTPEARTALLWGGLGLAALWILTLASRRRG